MADSKETALKSPLWSAGQGDGQPNNQGKVSGPKGGTVPEDRYTQQAKKGS